jgi:AAA family ATP:ADP antiporter
MKHRNSEAGTPGAANSSIPQKATKGNSSEESALLKFRNTIFPIYGKEEVKKFLLLGSIKFFIILALTLTRDTKDTLVVTQCGAEAIAFLKVRTFDDFYCVS